MQKKTSVTSTTTTPAAPAAPTAAARSPSRPRKTSDVSKPAAAAKKPVAASNKAKKVKVARVPCHASTCLAALDTHPGCLHSHCVYPAELTYASTDLRLPGRLGPGRWTSGRLTKIVSHPEPTRMPGYDLAANPYPYSIVALLEFKHFSFSVRASTSPIEQWPLWPLPPAFLSSPSRCFLKRAAPPCIFFEGGNLEARRESARWRRLTRR